jgi:site-specific recombinase XerD
MTDEAVSPLRRRMIEDMTIRKFAPKTQHHYVQRVKNFAAFLGRSPDTASFEDVRRSQLHLSERRWRADHQPDRLDAAVLFKVTLRRHEIVEHTHVIHEPRKLPVVLSVEEVARLFPGRDPAQPMTTRQLNRACHAAAQMAEINKRVSLHTLRHYVASRTMSRAFSSGLVFSANLFSP